MSQFVLPLEWPAGGEGFIVADHNHAAVRLLEGRGTWPVPAALLAGPPRSGRSLLGRLFAAATGGTLVDDAGGADEETLFHAWNAATPARPLLLVAVPGWAVRLPDLRSRLLATPAATIGPPDETFAVDLVAHHLARRGLAVPDELRAWLRPRVERDHAAAEALADRLDAAALAGRRRLTVPLARAVLEEGRAERLPGL